MPDMRLPGNEVVKWQKRFLMEYNISKECETPKTRTILSSYTNNIECEVIHGLKIRSSIEFKKWLLF